MKTRMLTILTVTLGLTLFTSQGTHATNDHDDGPKPVHKSYVCKYVGTPGEDERLRPGQNPIWVDNSALTGKDDDVKVGDTFSDKHGRSIVIVANTPKLNPEPGIDKCPPPDGDDEETTTTTSTVPPTTEPPTTVTAVPVTTNPASAPVPTVTTPPAETTVPADTTVPAETTTVSTTVPTSTLPTTGGGGATVAIIGLILTLMGIAAIVLSSRRRSA